LTDICPPVASGGALDEDEARKYFRQIVDGLAYIHSQGVCHRDLKPENLLLDVDGNIKITDFGLSNFIDMHSKPALLQTTCGTPYYVAPEVLNGEGYDGKLADVWSSGVILYNLLAGSFPFDGKRLPTLFNNILKKKFKCPNWFSAEAKLLMGRMLAKDPKQRITIREIQQTAWYNHGYASESPRKYPRIRVDTAEADAALSSAAITHELNGPDASAATPVPLPKLNAFDLMNLVGGLAMNNLFNYHKGSHVSWKRFYHFESGLPVDKIISGLKGIMQKNGMATLQSETPNSMVFHVKRKGHHSDLRVDVFMVLENIHIVKIRRGEGNAIAYYKFMSEIGPHVSKELGVPNQGPSGIVVVI